MKDLEEIVLQKAGDVITSINGAKNVGEVIGALHSFAVLTFPVDCQSFIGSTRDNKYIDHVHDDEVSHSEIERRKWWEVFYKGPAFPTLARVLLYDVACNWLSCFPVSARKNVYDVFFVSGCVTEVVQVVVPCLQPSSGSGSTYDISAVSSNAQRLLVLSLIENHGVLQIAKEISITCQDKGLTVTDQYVKQTVSNMVRLVTSIPDKAPPGASVSLSSNVFFEQIVAQLVHQSEEFCSDYSDKTFMDCRIVFTAETFVRICRRGSVDLLLKNLIPKILGQVRSLLLPLDADNTGSTQELKLTPGVQFWSQVVESMKDTYAIETMSERLLHQLASQNANDTEAYWILWIMFHHIFEQNLIKTMFVDKFLFWKVFPLCCLKWILHFAVLQCSPQCNSSTKAYSSRSLSDMVQRLVVVWAKREFVQSASLEQQAYITSALGLCLEKMSKEDLNTTKEAIHSILQGVSCRLESPDHLTRKMASSIALAFSKVIDPQNPLYLDDDSMHEGGVVDWDFGLTTIRHNSNAEGAGKESNTKSIVSGQELIDNNVKSRKKRSSEYKLVDPDEVIDPAILNVEVVGSEGEEEDDLSSEHSDNSSDDSSLQPYDLTEDDTDLQKKFSQLVDVVGALRKSDDPDNVEKALDVTENLVRASPDELRFVAGDLVRTLVQVRCSDISIEGEEISVEEKRQRALVALVVKCPMGSLETLHNLLYSPHIDVSQRIMILDVMTEAALELSRTRTSKPDNHYHKRPTISSVSDQPWFIPKSIGPSPWKEISTPGTPLNWSNSYERELPSKLGHIKKGKTRRWNLHTPVMGRQLDMEWSHNEFPQYVAAFMLPAMKGFDKKSHGVDLLGRDFIVLAKLIYMLGVCIKCASMHPEASVLASPLLDMLSMKEISHHKEAYVRRSVLFAASCILVALHPTYIASSLVDGNTELPKRLDWIRAWAHHVAESDTDKECYTLALTCLQLHSEMALQTSRALESTENTLGRKSIALPSNLSLGISKISFQNV